MTAPLRPCGVCRKPVPDGNCLVHPKRGGYRPHRPSVVKGAYGPLWRRLRDRALSASGFLCDYCLKPAGTGDHVIPVSKGGRSTPQNVLAACARCNTSKGDRTLREWVATGLAPANAALLMAQRINDQLPV